MSELNAAVAAEVVVACRANLGETVQVLGRFLEQTLDIAVGEPTPLAAGTTSDDAGPGLAVWFQVGGASAVATLAEASTLLPAWIAQPDATGTSKLATLAQELSMLLLPDALPADEFRAARVADLASAVSRAQPASESCCVPLELKTADGRTATLRLTFPLAEGAHLFDAAVAAPTPDAASPPREKPAGVLRGAEAERAAAQATHDAVEPEPAAPMPAELPSYTQSLLRIRVPVMVTLARRKQPVGKIVEIGPGTILQFAKPCEQLLDLEVNGRNIGQGEAVKVGDKFGLRLASLTLPGERFKPVRRAKSGG